MRRQCVVMLFTVMNRDKETFAATRPSSVLLEQLAVCVAKGEPVLLVGETGTGKTSTVQHLARVTGECRFIHGHRQKSCAVLQDIERSVVNCGQWFNFWLLLSCPVNSN